MQVKPDELNLDMPEVEVTDINLDAVGNVLPDKHDKKIIIDADTMIFAACSVCQEEIDEDEFTIDLEVAYKHALEKLNLILDRIGGKLENTELHFTGGKSSFRYELLSNEFPDDIDMWYKAKRKKKKSPAGLVELKKMFINNLKAKIHFDYEADDMVVYLKKKYQDDAILVAVDKDVLLNTPGKHWNYYDNQKYNKPMKWVEVDENTALYNQYIQAIVGDKSDNIPGLPGIGPKKAEKFLYDGMSEIELWEGVVNAYMKHCKYGDPEAMAILNMRLVNMHQLTDKGVELWIPPQR